MHDIASAFSQSYAEACRKFVAAAKERALPLETHVHPSLRGIGDETLAVDVAHWGKRDAPGLLLVSH